MKKDKILDSKQIERKLERMARQILEEHYVESSLILIGIEGQGMEVARRLNKTLDSIGKLNVNLESISLHKDNPLDNPINCSLDTKEIKGKVVVFVDDVLNSGRTMIYAVKHILESEPKGVYTATLIDRIHRSFSVRADYCGLSLSTHVDQHITVDLNKNSDKDSVYLEL